MTTEDVAFMNLEHVVDEAKRRGDKAVKLSVDDAALLIDYIDDLEASLEQDAEDTQGSVSYDTYDEVCEEADRLGEELEVAKERIEELQAMVDQLKGDA